jgi:hypothetical protein
MITKLKAFGITLLIMSLIGLFVWCTQQYPEIVTWVVGGGFILVFGSMIYFYVLEAISDED